MWSRICAHNAANILRRAAAAGEISADIAAMAHADLLDMRVGFFPYAPFAPRIWELKDDLTSYDAWYVALAEFLGSRVATLDLKLARATGPRCGFESPPAASEPGRARWAASAGSLFARPACRQLAIEPGGGPDR